MYRLGLVKSSALSLIECVLKLVTKGGPAERSGAVFPKLNPELFPELGDKRWTGGKKWGRIP
jgi:hypothetical protein